GGGASRPVARHPWQGNADAPAPGHLPFGSSLSAALARRTSRPLPALQLVFTSVPVFLAPDRLALLAVAVAAHTFTTGLAAEATLSRGLQTPLPAVVGNS